MADADLLKLNAELSLLLADYWHEIDFNGGRDASRYYTQDAEFHGQFASYLGVAKIQRFYDWRRDRGDRLSVHGFTNFRARFTGDDSAEATNFLFLYARDGVRPQPSHEPVTISLATDRYVRRDGRWLCTYRRFEHLFESDVPVTNPNLDEAK
jgi:hypothetical protein